jgi:hypothetical protein
MFELVDDPGTVKVPPQRVLRLPGVPFVGVKTGVIVTVAGGE